MMKYNPLSIALIAFLLILLVPHNTSATEKTFIKEYTYQASEDNSKNSSRTLAMREVKRLLLEEIGTYLESITEVQGFRLTKDQITTLTAGKVKTEIIEEKWDGRVFWLKSKITADPDIVIKSIDALRNDRTKMNELTEIRKQSDHLLKENNRLRRELSVSKGITRKNDEALYTELINELMAYEWFEKGFSDDNSNNVAGAIDSYSACIYVTVNR